MKRYKIEQKYDMAYWYSLCLKGDNGEHLDIRVDKKSTTNRLQPGMHVRILRDKFLSVEDYVYLYRDGMDMHTMPALMDAPACKLYINNLPGLFDCGRLDRVVFKVALWRECERRGIAPSLCAWHNLQNIMMNRAKNTNAR